MDSFQLEGMNMFEDPFPNTQEFQQNPQLGEHLEPTPTPTEGFSYGDICEQIRMNATMLFPTCSHRYLRHMNSLRRSPPATQMFMVQVHKLDREPPAYQATLTIPNVQHEEHAQHTHSTMNPIVIARGTVDRNYRSALERLLDYTSRTLASRSESEQQDWEGAVQRLLYTPGPQPPQQPAQHYAQQSAQQVQQPAFPQPTWQYAQQSAQQSSQQVQQQTFPLRRDPQRPTFSHHTQQRTFPLQVQQPAFPQHAQQSTQSS